MTYRYRPAAGRDVAIPARTGHRNVAHPEFKSINRGRQVEREIRSTTSFELPGLSDVWVRARGAGEFVGSQDERASPRSRLGSILRSGASRDFDSAHT